MPADRTARSALSQVLLGNEVSAYLAMHPSEVQAWKVLYEGSIDQLHASLPETQVGTVFIFDQLERLPRHCVTLGR
jgi:hypothetical protein